MKDMDTLKWISKVTGKAKLAVGALVLIQAVLSMTAVAFAFALRRIINTAIAGDGAGFRKSLILLMLVILIQIALSAVNRFLNDLTSSVVENRFKERLFSELLNGDYAAVTATHTGEWMNRLTSDTDVVSNGVTQIVPGMIGMLVRLFGAFSALLWLEPSFLYVFVPGGLIILVLTYGFRRKLKRLHKAIQEADGILRIFMQERLESLLIVRTFARERQSYALAVRLMQQHKQARITRSNFSNFCNIGFAGAMNGAYLLGIGFCGYGILKGTMSYGNLMAVMQLIGQIQSPFANITGYLPKYYSMIASAERLKKAEEFDHDNDNEGALSEAKVIETYMTKLLSIRLEHACFTYQPPVDTDKTEMTMPLVLKDINLTIHKGEYVAFTGPSGCGKSTVLKLLLCLHPLDSGLRLIETADGINPLTPSWRSLFAYVPQGNQLLSGSIRDIISFGDEERAQDDAAILKALHIACADDFVLGLRDGIDTVLGERGHGLSEGQMQRIAIARAVFSEHPILMLDESTSALDENTAKHLLMNLRSMTDKTVLMVTHRSNQTGFFDKELKFSSEGIEMFIKEKSAYDSGSDTTFM